MQFTIMEHNNIVCSDITIDQVWDLLQQPSAQLVDVRTEMEWGDVGIPDLLELNKQPIMLSWRTLPGMQLNQDFVTELTGKIGDKTTPILFLCRVGGRSKQAADTMANLGYSNCYNIIGGFEGYHDKHQHYLGWIQSSLSWRRK
jgi:rhodanese-related sulfurtransferase